MKGSFIKTEVTGFVVVETVKVELELNEEDQQLYASSPEDVIARLLREQGHEVNRVIMTTGGSPLFDSGGDEAEAITRARNNWFHIVYPNNEKSGWICCC